MALNPSNPFTGIGSALLEGLIPRLGQRRDEQRMIESMNPIREHILSQSRQAPFAGSPEGGGMAPAAAPQPAQGQQPTPQQRAQDLLAVFASDPRAFAEQFAGEGGIERLFTMQDPVPPEPPPPQTVVMSGDTPQGRALGIPPGERARVELQRNAAGNVINQSVKGRFAQKGENRTNVHVNLGADEFAKANAKTINDELTAMMESGRAAQNSLPTFDQAANLLQQGVQTGRGQSMVLPLRQLAEDFGVPLEGAAQKLGIELGEGNTLANQEDFQRLTTQLMLDSFQQFKGNLNQREVQMAENSVANIGTSEEANKRAIAAMRTAAEIAVARRNRALRVGSLDQGREFLVHSASTDTEPFEQRMEQHLEAMNQSSAPTVQSQPQAQPQTQPQPQATPQAPQQGPVAPPPGTIEEGHMFIGGDPADPNNWREIR